MARRRNKLDYFAFFPKDCEADESIRLMDDAQFGFWMRCLCLQWPNGSIPSDPEALATVLAGHAPGQRGRTPEYVAGMLAGPVGLRFTPLPGAESMDLVHNSNKAHLGLVVGSNKAQSARLADRRLLEERAIAEAETQRNRTNAENKGANNDVFVEGKTEKSCDDSLFCSVSVLSKEKEVEQWFDTEFWPMYPRKVAKPKALRAAKKHGDTPEARARIMETLRRALPALSRELKPDGDFRPYPASWINAEPWLDEPSAAQPTPAPKPWKADW